MGRNSTQEIARGESVSCVAAEPGPATFRQRFRRADAPLGEARETLARMARLFAGWGDLASISIGPPDPVTWAELERSTWPRVRVYPLAAMVLLYPAWSPDWRVLRQLAVRLPDGRVVNGASDEAAEFMARARLFWKRLHARERSL
jgi:hypothetical protein